VFLTLPHAMLRLNSHTTCPMISMWDFTLVPWPGIWYAWCI
jgi:hypothetical protein